MSDFPEGKHEGSHPRIILDLETDVGVHVHLGEKVRVLALAQQPALAVQPGGGRLVDLMELAQLIKRGYAHDHGTRQGCKGDHELSNHAHRERQ